LLDAGCGEGIYATLFAAIGFDVAGFDISPNCVEAAQHVAAANGFSERTRFSVQATEQLDYPDDCFDVVVGIDVLHHVEVATSVAELLRVLRPGGTALFREFVEVPAFDRVRDTALARFFFPKGKHQDHFEYTTEDERKLTEEDIATIREMCPALVERRFNTIARLDRFLRKPGQRNASNLEKLDHWLCGRMPSLSRFGGSVVLELKKAATGI
jgi:2-polyprenyl-3-methyl-5-hydroxy-6-metoxy-1,4-benzoquinol methylase